MSLSRGLEVGRTGVWRNQVKGVREFLVKNGTHNDNGFWLSGVPELLSLVEAEHLLDRVNPRDGRALYILKVVRAQRLRA
jgi:hypothetical protein